MTRAWELTLYPYKNLLLRMIPPALLTYVVLLPSQMSMFPTGDPTETARAFYSIAQMILPIAVLWAQFLYFWQIWQTDSRETVRALRHPDVCCSLVLFLEHQVRTIPLYIVYALVLPEERGMILVLVVQSFCVALGFLFWSSLCRSATAGMAILIAYISASTMLDYTSVPFLIQKNIIWSELPDSYFPVRILVALAETVGLRYLQFRRKRDTL